MKTRHEKLELFLLFALGLTVRILYDRFLRRYYFFYDLPSSDVLYYRNWVAEILNGHWVGEKAFSGMPFYPYMLSAIAFICQKNLLAIRVVHLALGAFNAVLCYYAGKKLFSPKVGLLAAALVTFNFSLIYYDWMMMPVPFIITLSLILVLLLLDRGRLTKKRQWLLIGGLLGLAVHADGKFVFFFVFVAIYLIWEGRRQAGAIFLKRVLPFSLGVALVLLGVAARNRVVSGDWIFMSAHSGFNLYIGNNLQADGAFHSPSFVKPSHEGHDEDMRIIANAMAGKNLRLGEVSKFWRQRAVQFMKDYPREYLALLKEKFGLFFTDTETIFDMDLLFQKKWKDRLDINRFYVILPMALLGLLLTLRKPGTVFPNFLIVSQLLFTLVFFLLNRHRITVLPFLILYQSYFIFWFISKLKQRHARAILAGLMFLGALYAGGRPQKIDPLIVEYARFSKMGYVFSAQKSYAAAKIHYLKALSIQPFDGTTLFNLGNACLNLDEIPEAIKYYEKAIVLAPRDIEVLYQLAGCYYRLRDSPKSIEIYQRIIEIDPGSADSYRHLGDIYKNSGNCPAAIHYYQKNLALKPKDSEKILLMIKECQNRPEGEGKDQR